MATVEPNQRFRNVIRDRLLIEMLRGTRSPDNPASDWKVLIMDDYTIKIMSTTCKMADITEEGISLVEDLNKKRQPVPLLGAVYFLQPSRASLNRLVEDMAGHSPLYKHAFIFFSSPIAKESLQVVKDNALLRSRIRALKEMNLEITTVDRQAFTTDQERALVELCGSLQTNYESRYEKTVDRMAQRLATTFASLMEFPVVRYRAAKTSATESGTPERARDLVPTKLAASLWDRILKYKHSLPNYPLHDTCDLLIVDRSVDPITPLIHDWSYAGLAYDLLPIDGNKYELEFTNAQGQQQRKTVLLEEHDPVWVELRDLFIGEALDKVTTLSRDVLDKSSVSKDGMSDKEMKALVANLGKITEQKDKVDLHINIARELMGKVQKRKLMDQGRLEQGFVFGDEKATFKELAAHLGLEGLDTMDKVRLLAVYAATHPDKYTPEKRTLWMKMASLKDEDVQPVNNMDHIGVVNTKAAQPKSSLAFGKSKNKGGGFRKERGGFQEGAWELMRFYPYIQDLLEDWHNGALDNEAYPFVQEPHKSTSSSGVPSMRGGGAKAGGGGWASSTKSATSVRTKPGGGTSASSVSETSSSREFVKGRRLFVFIVGGMMRSEIRVAHSLSHKLQREVIIGSSSLDTPTSFVKKLTRLDDDAEWS